MYTKHFAYLLNGLFLMPSECNSFSVIRKLGLTFWVKKPSLCFLLSGGLDQCDSCQIETRLFKYIWKSFSIIKQILAIVITIFKESHLPPQYRLWRTCKNEVWKMIQDIINFWQLQEWMDCKIFLECKEFLQVNKVFSQECSMLFHKFTVLQILIFK